MPETDDASSAGADFARLLRDLRRQAGLTQQELAGRAGISTAAVRDLEQRRTAQPHPASLRRIAAALGVGAADAEALRTAASRQRRPADAPAPEDPDAPVLVAVLGPLLLRRGAAPVALGAHLQRVLLGRLALSANASVPRSELLDTLWEDQEPPSALNLLQTYVTRLRRLLGAAATPAPAGVTLLLTPAGYQLRLTPQHLDLLRFRQRVAAAHAASAASPQTAMDELESALDLWRGETLADVEQLRHHPLAVAANTERVAATLLHADLGDRLGRHERPLPWLRRLAGLHPLHEPLQGRLMLALAATGQQAAALSVYDGVRGRLVEELGIDPGPELDEFRGRVLRQQWTRTATTPQRPAAPQGATEADTAPQWPAETDPASQWPAEADPAPQWPVEADPGGGGGRVPCQVPAPVADFTGREEQLDLLCQLLDRDPDAPPPPAVVVCAVAGVGGVGKTAVAVRAAHRLRAAFPDGQLHVDLHGAGPRPVTPVEALTHFLRALDVPPAAIPADQAGCEALYRSAVGSRRLLIVADNARDARQVRPLLPGSGGCGVVVTSRRRMIDLEGAHLVDLDMMRAAEALDLFAAVVGPARVLAEEQASSSVVHACGGLPLAIRIAGARLASRPQWTVALLARRLNDQRRRLDELRVGDLEVRASFRLSYQGMAPRIARTFRLLALAPVADIAVEAAAAMLPYDARDLEDDLDFLVDASLMDAVGPGRFRYHDLLRLYAADLAATEDPAEVRDAAMRRLLEFYLLRVAAAARLQHPNMVRIPLESPAPAPFTDCDEALGWLGGEIDAVVAVIGHAAEHGPPEVAWQLADQLRGYFFSGRHLAQWLASGEAGLRAAVGAGDARAQAAMRQTLGQAYWSFGDFTRSLAQYELGLDMARRSGSVDMEAYLLHNIGLVQLAVGRRAEAYDSYMRSLEVCRTAGLPYVQAVTLNDLGMMCWELGRLPDAVRYFTEALELNVRGDNVSGQGVNLANLGAVTREQGHFQQARTYLAESIELHRRTGLHYGVMAASDELAQVCVWEHNLTDAIRLAGEALQAARSMDDRPYQATILATLGAALLAAGETHDAAARLHESYTLACAVGAPYSQARALIGLALAAARQGEHAAGSTYATDALTLARQGGYRMLEADALVTLVRIDPDSSGATDVPEARTGRAAARLGAPRDRTDVLDLLGAALTICVTEGAQARADDITRLMSSHRALTL